MNNFDCRAFSLFETVAGSRPDEDPFYSIYAQARLFRHLANEHNFWNRSTFLKKHLISSRSFKESFSGNSVKISDCRAFSPVETFRKQVPEIYRLFYYVLDFFCTLWIISVTFGYIYAYYI